MTIHAGGTEISIVLVEDNPADVYLVEEALRTHDVRYSLRWISEPEEALALFRDPDTIPPYLVLLDLNLPRITGKQILAMLRKTPRFAGTTVAVLTSSDSPADRTEVEELGADCYIKKPLTLSEFMAIGGIIKQLVVNAPT